MAAAQRRTDDPLSARDVAELEVNQAEEDAPKLQRSAAKLHDTAAKVSEAGSTPLTGSTERVQTAGGTPSPPQLRGGRSTACPDVSAKGLAPDESRSREQGDCEADLSPPLACTATEFGLTIRSLAEGIASSGAKVRRQL